MPVMTSRTSLAEPLLGHLGREDHHARLGHGVGRAGDLAGDALLDQRLVQAPARLVGQDVDDGVLGHLVRVGARDAVVDERHDGHVAGRGGA